MYKRYVEKNKYQSMFWKGTDQKSTGFVFKQVIKFVLLFQELSKLDFSEVKIVVYYTRGKIIRF